MLGPASTHEAAIAVQFKNAAAQPNGEIGTAAKRALRLSCFFLWSVVTLTIATHAAHDVLTAGWSYIPISDALAFFLAPLARSAHRVWLFNGGFETHAAAPFFSFAFVTLATAPSFSAHGRGNLSQPETPSDPHRGNSTHHAP